MNALIKNEKEQVSRDAQARKRVARISHENFVTRFYVIAGLDDHTTVEKRTVAVIVITHFQFLFAQDSVVV